MDSQILLILFLFLRDLFCVKLLYPCPHKFCLVNFNPEIGNLTSQYFGANNNKIISFDYYHDENVIYWSDGSSEAVRRYQKASSNQLGSKYVEEVLSNAKVTPEHLAIDWVGGKLYWIGSGGNTVEVSNLDGTYRKVLIWDDIVGAQNIVLHPLKRLLFWTDCGYYLRVGRAGMDGSERSVVLEMNTCVFWTNSLSIDYSEDRLYLTDGKNSRIFSSLIDGTGLREIIPRGLAHPSHVSVSAEFILWVNWKNSSIHYCRKYPCNETKFLTSTDSITKDFKVVQPERSHPVSNPCWNNNGGCSHLCLLSPSTTGFSCACPVGIKMTEDGKKCADGASEILLVVRLENLRWMSLDTPDLTNLGVPLVKVNHAVDVTYDPVHSKVYWSDLYLRSIVGAHLNGSGLEVVVNASTICPEGVALDWRSRNLFWIDSCKDRIQVTQLDGLFDKVIIDTGLFEPRAIAIDPMKGLMFWGDWGNQSKLEMSFMDGSERRTLVNTDIVWPNGLAYDPPANRLYWGDASRDVIAYIRLDTLERVILLEGISHVFGLTILGEFIYWSDQTERSISRANRESGSNRTRIAEELSDIMSIKAVDLRGDGEENLCSRDNGGCSHFCFMKLHRRVCACPDDIELLYDDTSCNLPHLFLIYATSLTIHRVSIVTGRDVRLVSGVGAKGIKAIATDPVRKRIFWSYAINKSIHVVNINPTHIGRVVGSVDAEDMAVDYLSNHLYWSDLLTNRIEMMKLEEKMRSIVVWKELIPSKMAIDPKNGWLFWVNSFGGKHVIERSRLNGVSRMVIVSDAGTVISKVVVDIPGRLLFWLRGDVLFSSTFDGKNPTAYSASFPLFHDFGVLDESLYVLTTRNGNVERFLKDDPRNLSAVFPVGHDVVGISVLDVSRDLQEKQSACQVNNGGCSHFCINMGDESLTSSACPCDGYPHEYANNNRTTAAGKITDCPCYVSHVCTCPTHYSLEEDGRTCKAPGVYLLLGQNSSILRLPVDRSPSDTVEVNLQVLGVRSLRSIKHDPKERRIFWVDNRNKSLKSIPEAGGQISVLMQQVVIVDMTLDVNAQLIYYTENTCNCIQVVRYNGTLLGKVVAEGQPKHLAIAFRAGYLFWTNRGKTPRLERSSLDGSSKITLINTGLGQLGPIEVDNYKALRTGRSMASLQRNGRIYWIDQDLRRIESADFGGNGRQVVVHDTDAVGIVVFGSWFLWATKDNVQRVNITDGGGGWNKRGETIWNCPPYISSVASAVADSGDRDLGDSCLKNTCTHFCVKEDEVSHGDKGPVWRCSCPIGKQLVDDACKEPVACNDDQFTCLSTGLCITVRWRCDQHADCEDRSDEADCRNCSKGRCPRRNKVTSAFPKCDEDMRTCANMECVSSERWCDGIPDCSDSSDETDCLPLENESAKSPSNAYYAVGLGIASAGIVLIACILLLAFICRQKSRNLATAYADNIVMVARPSPPPLSLPDSSTLLLGAGELCSQNDGDCVPRMNNRAIQGSSKSYFGDLDDMTYFDSTIIFRDGIESGASESVFYDRGHITGASSSTGSTLTNRPSFDPPPSPMTDRSMTCTSPSIPSYGQTRGSNRYHYGHGAPSGHNSSHRIRKRRKKHRSRHLPTPCSSTTEEGTLCDHYPFAPPPPTPLSGSSLSGDLKTPDLSYPPSPSTGRSLYPPPPPSSLRCLSEEEDDDDDDDEEDDNHEHDSCDGTCSNKTEK